MFNRKLREENIALMEQNNQLKRHIQLLEGSLENLLHERAELQKDHSLATETIQVCHKEIEWFRQENKRLAMAACNPVPECDSECEDAPPRFDVGRLIEVEKKLCVLEHQTHALVNLYDRLENRIENLEAAINPDVIQAWKKQVANLVAANEKLKKKAKR